jgi:hypothetical protein
MAARTKKTEPATALNTSLDQAFIDAGSKFPFTVYAYGGAGAGYVKMTITARDKEVWQTDYQVMLGDGSTGTLPIDAGLSQRLQFSVTAPKSSADAEIEQLEKTVQDINEALAKTKKLNADYRHLVRFEGQLSDSTVDLSNLKLIVDAEQGGFKSSSGTIIVVGNSTSLFDGRAVKTSDLFFALKEITRNGRPTVTINDFSLVSAREGVFTAESGVVVLTWSEADDVLSFMEDNRKVDKKVVALPVGGSRKPASQREGQAGE